MFSEMNAIFSIFSDNDQFLGANLNANVLNFIGFDFRSTILRSK